MVAYLSRNKPAVVLLVCAAGLSVAMLFASGCTFATMVKVPVPQSVQKTLGVGPKVTLAEAPGVLARYDAANDADRQVFVESIENASWFVGLADSFVNLGIESGAVALQGVPGGAIGVALLTGLGGLLMDKPGARKKAQDDVKTAIEDEAAKWKSKIDSYNKAKQDEREAQVIQAAAAKVAE